MLSASKKKMIGILHMSAISNICEDKIIVGQQR